MLVKGAVSIVFCSLSFKIMSQWSLRTSLILIVRMSFSMPQFCICFFREEKIPSKGQRVMSCSYIKTQSRQSTPLVILQKSSFVIPQKFSFVSSSSCCTSSQ